MTPEEVYHSNEEYKKWPKEIFKTNFRNLHKKISKDKAHSCFDNAAYEHDRILLFELPESSATSSEWNFSAAKHLLRQDMDDRKHPSIKSMNLYFSREEYQVFDPETFWKRIYQEESHRAKNEGGLFRKKKILTTDYDNVDCF
eukprot:2907461-Ditylum_brightwellii.AAC.1